MILSQFQNIEHNFYVYSTTNACKLGTGTKIILKNQIKTKI